MPAITRSTSKGFFRLMFQPSPAALRGRAALVATLTALFLLAGCGGPRIVTPEPPPLPEGGTAVPEENEVVLTDGTQLVADAPWGQIKIEAGPGLRRVYTWRGNRRGVVLEPREQRFAGSMGIHYEGKPPVWEPVDGITQVDLEEGQRRFENVDDAMIWMQIRRLRYSYTNDGLVIGWKPKDDTLKVELWQFYIDGEKPTSLPNADDTRLALGPLTPVPQKMKPKLMFADGHTEPYTTKTASKYSIAQASGAASTSETGSSSAMSHCNWFKRLLGQCTVTSADTAQNTAQSETDTDTAAETAAASPAPDSARPAISPAASSDTADSTADKQPPSGTDESAPRAQIEGKVVNIRSRPSTDSDVLSQGKEGDSVVILKKDRGWRYVEFDDGHKGWVADFLLKH